MREFLIGIFWWLVIVGISTAGAFLGGKYEEWRHARYGDGKSEPVDEEFWM